MDLLFEQHTSITHILVNITTGELPNISLSQSTQEEAMKGTGWIYCIEPCPYRTLPVVYDNEDN